ncbi:PX domain-containing protein kinase-like protein [Paramacrobiotus metropolitanus]|uniref:PX domain-containing protein kinase-like protein n=1 Tax=Paramacrobiotus metropolitanus TaxID=2943436 RepID=UPI0024455FE7|nr:PX domain-containing protein kinase-like protein [Paramacrobiotus metropolitanus]
MATKWTTNFAAHSVSQNGAPLADLNHEMSPSLDTASSNGSYSGPEQPERWADRGSQQSHRHHHRDPASEEFFNSHRYDDLLPLCLDIVDERKEKGKRTVMYTVRVRTGPFSDAAYKDFMVEISCDALHQLAADLKREGYAPGCTPGHSRTRKTSGREREEYHHETVEPTASPCPSPVPSLASDQSSASSVAGELDVLTALPTNMATMASTKPAINARRTYWQEFLQSICTSLLACTNPSLRYLLFPKLGLTDWHGLAMQHAKMVLNSEGIWEIDERLPCIGWRFAKHYAIVRESLNRDSKLMMSWTFVNRKYSHVEVKERQEALKQLQVLHLQHPLIFPIVYESFHEAGCLIMEPICSGGSLKDRIYKSRFTKHFHKKYIRCHERRPFSLDEVRTYGRQILEALNVIHEAGIPYGNLHARNVMLERGTCRLAGLHNSIIGLPAYYRPYLVQLPKISMFPSIDVYCFGRILYEMTFGEGLDAPCIESLPPECPSDVQSILNLLITTEACFVKGMPTVKFLLSIPFFSSVTMQVECPPIRLTSKVVGFCRGLAERIEKRLSEGEKTFHNTVVKDGPFFRPISPVLGRVRKSGSIQVIRRFFSPSHKKHRSPSMGCFALASASAQDTGSESASDVEDAQALALRAKQTRSRSLDMHAHKSAALVVPVSPSQDVSHAAVPSV